MLQIQRQLVDMNVIFRPQLNNVHAIFMPPNFEEVQGGILIWSCPPVRYDFLRTRYLKNRLTYGVDIWYTVSLPYENVLINFKAECIKYCQRYSPFMSRHKKWRGIMLYPPNFWVSVRPSVRPSEVEHSCPLHNFDTVRDNFTKLGTNINHDQTTCRD